MSFNWYEYLDLHLKGGRNPYDRPLANNTRAQRRGEHTIAVRLHSTDIVFHHDNAPTQLFSGGWRTYVTKERINSFSNARVYSEQGVWYIDLPPRAEDPKPDYQDGWRKVLKPFHALDPGPEPVKTPEGCIAGTEEVTTERRKVYAWRGELRDDDEIVDESGGGLLRVKRDVTTVTRYVEDRSQTWSHLAERQTPFEHEGDERKRVVCPHCELFERQHEAWSLAYNGERWGRGRDKGYRQMVEALERYGSREAWQEAYIADFRRARDANRRWREWCDRNRTLFEEGIEVDENGYALVKGDDSERLAEIEAMKKRIAKFVRGYIAELRKGMPMPGPGDCWYCSLTQVPSGQPMGDAMPTLYPDGDVKIQPNHEHLLSHIDEPYYVPTLAVNAMRERGYKDTGIYILLGMHADERTMGGRQDKYDSVARALRAYLQSRLIPDASGSAPSGARWRQTGLQTG